MFKAATNYDIYDDQKNLLLECREPILGFFTKIFRFTKYKHMTPFNVIVTDVASGQQVLRIEKDLTWFRSIVRAYDEKDQLQGTFRQRLLTIGGKFDILDEYEVVKCQVKGKWTSWEFSFEQGGQQLAQVTKKWAGVGKELFTTADNYVVAIDPSLPAKDDTRLLILAAALCIDKVLKE